MNSVYSLIGKASTSRIVLASLFLAVAISAGTNVQAQRRDDRNWQNRNNGNSQGRHDQERGDWSRNRTDRDRGQRASRDQSRDWDRNGNRSDNDWRNRDRNRNWDSGRNRDRDRDRDDRSWRNNGVRVYTPRVYRSYPNSRVYGNYGGNYGRYGNYGSYGNYGYGGDQLAEQQGYQDGLNTGASDAARGQSYNPQRSHYYRNANSGYNSSYGYRGGYQQVYRNAFLRGYQDGYQQYGGSNRIWRR